VGIRGFRLAAALTAVVVIAGCGMTGTEPNEPSQNSGHVTLGDKSRPTQSVTCTQVDMQMTIKAVADPGHARAALQLGGDKPVVKTVAIENIDGLSGVSGGDAGKAEASANGSSSYTIRGTATVNDAAHPGRTQNVPFEIVAPC